MPRHYEQAERAAWRRYLRFWGPRAEADVDDELRFHVEMRVRDYMARGLTETEARAATARRLGDLALARDACVTIDKRRERRMHRVHLLDAFVQDLRYAARTLGRQKGWTAVAVLTLALGIGANTAMFGVVNSLLLHPLPYPDADRVVIAFQQPSHPSAQGVLITVTPSTALVRAWRESARSLEAIQPYATTDVTYQPRAGDAAVLHEAAILPGFPRFAGHGALVGRTFTDDEVATAARVVMLSEPLWRGRFGSDPSVVGRSISLDGAPYTVVGVLPAAVRLPRLMQDATDLWVPLDLRRDAAGLGVVGRLRPGVTMAAATHELDAIAARVDSTSGAHPPFTTRLMAPRELVRFRDSLVLLTAAVALVLLIACANVAHLLLARAATRQRELAIRAALGAGRGRLFRQLLTESVVLAAAGCAGGIAVGWLGVRAIVTLRPESLAELSAARMDVSTLLAAIAVSALTAIAFGLIGAVQAARHSTHESLKSGAPSASHGRRHNRLRSLLVVSEMALSTTLIIAATLLVRSVVHLQTTDPGFDPAGLYSLQLRLPEARYTTPAARAAFGAELAARARTLPGVRELTTGGATPPYRSFMIGALQIEGDPTPPAGTTGFIDYNAIQPDYFRLMRIRLLQGTTFTDTTEAAGQVIVNEGLARKRWPGQSALGHRLRVVFNGTGTWKTIVGVAANASTGGLLADATEPMLYLPGNTDHDPTLILRTSGDAIPIASLRALVRSIDPTIPPPNITSVNDALAQSIAGPRFTMMLLAAFTVLALVLAAVGLYGVMAYAVAQRTREIGIRIALGASRRTIARAVVAQGVAMSVAGVIIGLVGAAWATKLVDQMLYGVARSDPLSFALGTAVLVTTALLACVVPMSRAMAVDPLIAMRAD